MLVWFGFLLFTYTDDLSATVESVAMSPAQGPVTVISNPRVVGPSTPS